MADVPFKIHVSEDVLTDLKERLLRTRSNHSDNHHFETNFDKTYGQLAAHQSELLHHWTHNYDWRIFERELNSFPNFKMDLDKEHGVHLHFIHVRSQNLNAVPLILVHGWPGSVWEFHRIIPMLSPHFHIVAPSLPGYGWSTTRSDKMHVEKIGHVFNDLMARLGYFQYVAQAAIGHCVAMHSNMPLFMPKDMRRALVFPSVALDYLLASRRLSQFEIHQLKQSFNYLKTGLAYLHLQASKPHSLGYALADSPAGLLAWISEKIALWSDPSQPLSKDDIITNVMIYWVTNSAASSMRLYYESLPIGKDDWGWESKVDVIDTPTGFAFFPKEAISFPLKWLKLTHSNVVHSTEFKLGGHFAAWEQPQLLAEDIIRFVFQKIGSFELACESAKTRKQPVGLSFTEMLRPAVALLVVLVIWRKFRRG